MRKTTVRFTGVRMSSYRVSSALLHACWLLTLAFDAGRAIGAEEIERQIKLNIPLEGGLLQWGDRAGIDGNTVRVMPPNTSIHSISRLRLSDSGVETPAGSQDDVQTKQGNVPVAQSRDAPNQSGSRGKSMEEVTVTAQKRAERLQDVPISISVVGGEDLDKSTFDGVTETLNTLPGVSAFANQIQSGGTLLSFRGVGPGAYSYGGASTVAYYIDSVPFGMMRTALLPDANVYDLQQIEVLRGPQGTLYGANALNGVLRVLTASPDLINFDFKTRSLLSTTEGGGANYGGDLAVNIPIIDGRLAARATVGDSHESGWVNGPLGTHLNDGETLNVRLKIKAQMTDELSVDLSAWHSQSRYDAPAESDSNRNAPFFVLPQPMNTQFNAYGFKLNYDAPHFTLSSMTSYVGYTNASFFDLDFCCGGINFASYLSSRVISEEIDLASKATGPWRWSAGAMYRDDKDASSGVNYNSAGKQTATFFDFDDVSRSAAVYGELGYRFLQDMLQWTVGLRYFHDDESTFANELLPTSNVFTLAPTKATSSATTPRVVLSWFPSTNLTTYASYSQGFRSGVPQDELVGAVVQNFPAVKPDKLINYEAGAKGNLWDRRLAYDVAVYYMKWQDIQQELSVQIPETKTYVSALVNGKSASGHGADVSLKTQPLTGFTLGGDFSWNTLHFDSGVFSNGQLLFVRGSRPNYSPKYTAGLSLQYTFPLGDGGLRGLFSASGNYLSPLNTSYLTVGQLQANSMLLTRGMLGIETPVHWAISLFVENANNYYGTQVPFTYPASYGLNPRVQPRTYGVRFDYHLR